MGKYTVPEEIRKLAPDGTMVKKQGNGYYVYEYSSKKEKKLRNGSWKWTTVTKMGSVIGKITLQDGFIPNSNKLNRTELSVLEYGAYALAINKSQPTYKKLTEIFNIKDAQKIYTIALIFFVDGFRYIKDIKRYYEMSYLSVEYPNITLGYDSVHNLYSNLGLYGELPKQFQQELLDHSSKRMAIDGHVIACTSRENDLSEYGYKAKQLRTEQINWMTIYDVMDRRPLVSQMINGANPDKTAVYDIFNQFTFNQTEFLVDRGFNTKPIKNLMSQNGNSYIVPMVSGRKDYVYVHSHLKFDKRRYFSYTSGKYATIVRYSEYTYDQIRYIAYQDVTQAATEEADFLRKMQAGLDGYTEKNYKESEIDFGVFMLEVSSKDISAKDAFMHYKARWTIETFYDYIDNRVDFNALYQQEESCTEGLGFIMQITGMIYENVKSCTDKAGINLKDTLDNLQSVKLFRGKRSWELKNDIKGIRDTCSNLEFNLPQMITFSTQSLL